MGGRHEEISACLRGGCRADHRRMGREDRRVDGAVRRQLPDRAAQRHAEVCRTMQRRRHVQIEDAQNDVAKQLDQIKNFIAAGVDAIIVNPVDTSATAGDVRRRRRRQIPLVYVNRQPINRRHAAGQPGLRRLERSRLRHARDQGSLPPVQGSRQDRGQRLCDHGRALQPGRACSAPRTSTT